MQEVTLHKGFLNSDKETVVSKPNASKWAENGVYHKFNSNTWLQGPPKDHPEYDEWYRSAEIKLKAAAMSALRRVQAAGI